LLYQHRHGNRPTAHHWGTLALFQLWGLWAHLLLHAAVHLSEIGLQSAQGRDLVSHREEATLLSTCCCHPWGRFSKKSSPVRTSRVSTETKKSDSGLVLSTPGIKKAKASAPSPLRRRTIL